MATYIQGIQTSVGVVKYDYNYLANLPESDMTLSKQGAFADALVVGRKQINTSLLSMTNNIETIQNNITTLTQNTAEIKKSADNANSSVTTLQETIKSLQTRIEALEKTQTK